MISDSSDQKKPSVKVEDIEVTTTEQDQQKTHDWPRATVAAKTHDWPRIHVTVKTHDWPRDKAMPDEVEITFDLVVSDD